jgi:hypothetical protein
MDEIILRSMASGTKQDHYQSVLARMVSAVSQDHAQLRTLIYEFARRKLRKDLFRQFEDGDWSEIEKQVSTLEEAIGRIEADFSHTLPRLSFETEQAPTVNTHEDSTSPTHPLQPISQRELMVGDYSGRSSSTFLSPTAYDIDYPKGMVNVTEYDGRSAGARVDKLLHSNFWRTIELIVAVVLGLAIYTAIDGQTAFSFLSSHQFGRSANTSSSNTTTSDQNAALTNKGPETATRAPPRSGVSNIPLPTAYGVYVLSNGQLTALDLLPIKVPDSRIAISASISTPSQAHLPPGELQFVVYRRDLLNDAPDRVSVRAIAQVMRALTVGPGGKAAYINVESTWVVRSTSYQMSVAPAADSSEMIVIRPDRANFAFPAGRYALVLKKEAYDFTVDGPIHDAAHCLERTDALGGGVYSECPHP